MDKEIYKNLIPVKNYSKARYMAYLDAILSHGVTLGTTIETLPDSFDLNNAAGDQLDIIGTLVGIDRLLPYTPTTGNREMDDDEYRMFLKLKIARNVWNGTNDDAAAKYKSIFSSAGAIIQRDNQDMTVTVIISELLTVREAEIIYHEDLLLVPAGVFKTIEYHSGSVDVTAYSATAISGQSTFTVVPIVNNR